MKKITHLPDGKVVMTFNIIGTSIEITEVYEPDQNFEHSSLTYIDEQRYGDIHSRPFVSDLPAMSNERVDAWLAFMAANEREYQDAIDQANKIA